MALIAFGQLGELVMHVDSVMQHIPSEGHRQALPSMRLADSNSQVRDFTPTRLTARRAISVLMGLSAIVALFSGALPTLDATIARELVTSVLGFDSVIAVYSGVPSVGFAAAGNWVVQPIDPVISSASLLGLVLIIGAATTWRTRAPLVRSASALLASVAIIAACVQARLVGLIAIWAFSGIDAYHAAAFWITVTSYVLALTGVAAVYFFLICRPAHT